MLAGFNASLIASWLIVSHVSGRYVLPRCSGVMRRGWRRCQIPRRADFPSPGLNSPPTEHHVWARTPQRSLRRCCVYSDACFLHAKINDVTQNGKNVLTALCQSRAGTLDLQKRESGAGYLLDCPFPSWRNQWVTGTSDLTALMNMLCLRHFCHSHSRSICQLSP